MTGRLPQSPTQIFDRTKPVKIVFNGRSIDAFEGDTVASALLSAGLDTFSRSFKYHRRRSASCLTGQCSRCTMNVDGRMHVKTCQTPVREGMVVEPQGNLERDSKAIADSFSWAMPTGFYYKMFYKPRWFWKRIKETIRAMPGNMAEVKPLATRPQFDAVNLSPEMLVVGGGLAGMEAAITAAEAGARVVLAETDPQLGGFERFQGDAGYDRTRESIGRLEQHGTIRILTSTTVAAIYPYGLAVCVESCSSEEGFVERSHLVRPRAMVIATGTGSMPMMFAHNDRPGVMLPEAAQRLIELWGIEPGKRVLLAGGDDYMARVALQLIDKGVKVAGLVDFRADGLDEGLKSKLSGHGVRKRAAMTWARRLKRVFNIDITTCDNCGADVRIIASIEDTAVIQKILAHLDTTASSAATAILPDCRASPSLPLGLFD